MALRNSHSNLLNLFDLLSHLETPPSGETGKTVSAFTSRRNSPNVRHPFPHPGGAFDAHG